MKAKKTAVKAKSAKAPRPAKGPAKAVRPAKKAAGSTSRRPATKKKSVRRKTVAVELPAILFEGDAPARPVVSGPGEKFSLGPTGESQDYQLESGAAELPSSYGSGRLFLTARDPHWLYAYWDLTPEQQAAYNRQSADGHLILRIYQTAVRDLPFSEVHVHPESRHWFAHVGRGETCFVAELGFYQRNRSWKNVATSASTLTPPDTVSPDTSFSFATIPANLPFETLVTLVRRAVQDHVPLAEAIEQLRQSGYPDLPGDIISPLFEWSPAQEQALAAVVNVDHARRVWVGSLEITELIRRQFDREISSLGVAQFGWPSSPFGAVSSVSSPFGGEQPQRGKGFWFNVNAELIIYGATEPDASVTIGGRKIKLRPDGSFSYRFALPDGRYDLPVVAISADQTDGRAAELKFSRHTEYRGDVGKHPQDPALKTPTPENV